MFQVNTAALKATMVLDRVPARILLTTTKDGKKIVAGNLIKINVEDLVQSVCMTIDALTVLVGTMGSITVGRDRVRVKDLQKTVSSITVINQAAQLLKSNVIWI